MASTRIAAIWKGIRVRSILDKIIMARRRSTLFLQSFFRFRLHQKYKAQKKYNSAVLIQKMCRVYLVTKKYMRLRGGFTINNNLAEFADMKLMIAERL